jgi:hypothetical protein
MDAITFKYSSDSITTYNLTEYAYYITGINDITVEFVEEKAFWFLESLVNTIVDLRIENLLGIEHKELRDDFKFLIKYHWKILYIHYANDSDMGNGRYGDFSFDMSGSLYWLLQKRYRGAELIPPQDCETSFLFKTIEGMEQLFENEFVPVLTLFVNLKKSSLEIARKIFQILKITGNI